MSTPNEPNDHSKQIEWHMAFLAAKYRAAGLSRNKLVAIWANQSGRCAITTMPMVLNSKDIDAAVVSKLYVGGNYTDDNVQLICKWVKSIKGTMPNHKIKMILSRFRAFRTEVQNGISLQHMMMDHFADILRRAGFSTANDFSNQFGVYKRFKTSAAKVEFYDLGYIHFQSEEIACHRNGHHYSELTSKYVGPADLIVDLSDPNYHIKILKFFGVEKYELQVFADHHTFDDL